MSEKQIATTTVEPSIGLMLQKILETGVSSDNVSALEKLCDLYERVEARKSERIFNESFTRLMAEVPGIKATRAVPNNDGTVRYKFAPLEEIDAQVRPLALKHGFTYSFSEGEQADTNKITKVCTIYHLNGHKRSNSFTVRKSAPPRASDTQADGSTHSYAKRGAICDAFGIIVEHDDDAKMVGKPIGMGLAADLRDRVEAVGADEQAFLKYAGVACKNPATLDDYMEIPDDRYDSLDELLKKKEGRRA